MSFLLQQALIDPSAATKMHPRQQGALISQARNSRLLASLAVVLKDSGNMETLPEKMRRHLRSALVIHAKQKMDLNYETDRIRSILRSADENLLLLKGGAYIQAELPVGKGRLITDIDILVSRKNIENVERTLKAAGWEGSQIDDYDDHYYRRWGHEIPPLISHRRGTTLDVHHNILPPTAGPNVDACLLLKDAIEIAPGIFTLSWRDMVIHSATHLFHEGEFHHGLRDLWDLDRMLRDFPDRDPHFWNELLERAERLQLQVSLFHGLNYTHKVFGTPLPAGLLREARDRAQNVAKPIVDFLYLRAFRPDHPDSRLLFTGPALFLLYVRSHYLRMPIYLLLPHLTRKLWKRCFQDDSGAPLGLDNKTGKTANQ
ncbi:MAG: nucleotidyltransferase family protein [Halioglobus sp.]|nr:nucleotidyltransferase family protein [Halioglobus sp.]